MLLPLLSVFAKYEFAGCLFTPRRWLGFYRRFQADGDDPEMLARAVLTTSKETAVAGFPLVVARVSFSHQASDKERNGRGEGRRRGLIDLDEGLSSLSFLFSSWNTRLRLRPHAFLLPSAP